MDWEEEKNWALDWLTHYNDYGFPFADEFAEQFLDHLSDKALTERFVYQARGYVTVADYISIIGQYYVKERLSEIPRESAAIDEVITNIADINQRVERATRQAQERSAAGGQIVAEATSNVGINHFVPQKQLLKNYLAALADRDSLVPEIAPDEETLSAWQEGTKVVPLHSMQPLAARLFASETDMSIRRRRTQNVLQEMVTCWCDSWIETASDNRFEEEFREELSQFPVAMIVNFDRYERTFDSFIAAAAQQINQHYQQQRLSVSTLEAIQQQTAAMRRASKEVEAIARQAPKPPSATQPLHFTTVASGAPTKNTPGVVVTDTSVLPGAAVTVRVAQPEELSLETAPLDVAAVPSAPDGKLETKIDRARAALERRLQRTLASSAEPTAKIERARTVLEERLQEILHAHEKQITPDDDDANAKALIELVASLRQPVNRDAREQLQQKAEDEGNITLLRSTGIPEFCLCLIDYTGRPSTTLSIDMGLDRSYLSKLTKGHIDIGENAQKAIQSYLQTHHHEHPELLEHFNLLIEDLEQEKKEERYRKQERAIENIVRTQNIPQFCEQLPDYTGETTKDLSIAMELGRNYLGQVIRGDKDVSANVQQAIHDYLNDNHFELLKYFDNLVAKLEREREHAELLRVAEAARANLERMLQINSIQDFCAGLANYTGLPLQTASVSMGYSPTYLGQVTRGDQEVNTNVINNVQSYLRTNYPELAEHFDDLAVAFEPQRKSDAAYANLGIILQTTEIIPFIKRFLDYDLTHMYRLSMDMGFDQSYLNMVINGNSGVSNHVVTRLSEYITEHCPELSEHLEGLIAERERVKKETQQQRIADAASTHLDAILQTTTIVRFCARLLDYTDSSKTQLGHDTGIDRKTLLQITESPDDSRIKVQTKQKILRYLETYHPELVRHFKDIAHIEQSGPDDGNSSPDKFEVVTRHPSTQPSVTLSQAASAPIFDPIIKSQEK